MADVGAYEAKTHLSALLRRVEEGERITITRHGVAVAQLKTFSRGRLLGSNHSIRELIDDGRRP